MSADPELVLLRPNQALQAMSVSRSTLNRLIKRGPERGGIESHLISPRIRVIPREAIDDYLRRLREQTAAST
jgi:hypothetical protein